METKNAQSQSFLPQVTTCFTDGIADVPAEFCKLRHAEGQFHRKVSENHFAQRDWILVGAQGSFLRAVLETGPGALEHPRTLCVAQPT